MYKLSQFHHPERPASDPESFESRVSSRMAPALSRLGTKIPVILNMKSLEQHQTAGIVEQQH